MVRPKISQQLFKQFFESEKSSGFILIFFTIVSLVIANSAFNTSYQELIEYKLFGMSLEHLINDGLMAFFFLLVGLELKREFMEGELSSIKTATLPLFSALGGMLVPAAIFIYCNWKTPNAHGFGIPMATDIAFALGALSLLGKKVPLSIKVFLTALAVIDDLGAILVIAFFYTKTILWINLFIALGIFVVLLILNKKGVSSLLIYLSLGITMWYFMHFSGIHATITGVLLAVAIPAKRISKFTGLTPSNRLQTWLHYPVPFFILPLFALVNTAIVIDSNWTASLLEKVSLGIIFGLVIGKPVGIFLFSWIAVKLKIANKPKGATWNQVFGVSILGGIGFTMSIFVTILAFDDGSTISHSKLAILVSSLIAGVIGICWLQISFAKRPSKKLKN